MDRPFYACVFVKGKAAILKERCGSIRYSVEYLLNIGGYCYIFVRSGGDIFYSGLFLVEWLYSEKLAFIVIMCLLFCHRRWIPPINFVACRWLSNLFSAGALVNHPNSWDCVNPKRKQTLLAIFVAVDIGCRCHLSHKSTLFFYQ